MFFEVKKRIQKLMIFFGITGIVWWAINCKMKFGGYTNVPGSYLVPYFIFIAVIGLGIYGLYILFKLERNIIKLITNEENN